MIVRKFVLIADSQKPRWWAMLGTALMLLGVVVLGLLADTVPVLALLAGLVPLCVGAALLGRGDQAERQRAERAAKTAQIERELDLG